MQKSHTHNGEQASPRGPAGTARRMNITVVIPTYHDRRVPARARRVADNVLAVPFPPGRVIARRL